MCLWSSQASWDTLAVLPFSSCCTLQLWWVLILKKLLFLTPPPIFSVDNMLCFLLQVVIKKWSIPCPLPHNVTTLSGAFQVTTTTPPPPFPFCSCPRAHKHTYIRYQKSDVGSLDQKVTVAGLWGKPMRPSLLIESTLADEDQRGLQRALYGELGPVLRGRKFMRPCVSLEMTCGLLELYKS